MAGLAEADMSITRIAEEGQDNRFFGDDKLLVKFHIQPKQNQHKTEDAGRPIFEDKTYITIRVPGNKQSIIIRPLRETDKKRFPAHWKAYEEGGVEEFVSGTPLEAWPALGRSQIEELKYFNIRTVEQLAGMNDSDAQGFMGMNTLKGKAAVYLEAAKGGAPMEKWQSDMEELQNKIDSDGEAIKAQATRIAELEEQLED